MHFKYFIAVEIIQALHKIKKKKWNHIFDSIFFFATSLKNMGYPAGNYMFKVNNRNTTTKVQNMFKVNNKDTKTTPLALFGVFIVNFEHISHLCSSFSIVNFE